MSLKVYYFDVYGRAEPIRMLLSHAKVPFEDVRLQAEDFAKLKTDQNKLEFAQLPVIEHDGRFMSQSISILRYLGAQHGYYPADANVAW